jgi:hypothetical protein
MSHKTLPIRFRFFKFPVVWDAVTEKTGNGQTVRSVRGRIENWRYPNEVPLSELNGWELRKEFFAIPIHDEKRLLLFLNKVGEWSLASEVPGTRYWLNLRNKETRIPLKQFWYFREHLKSALRRQTKGTFIKDLASALPQPKTLHELVSHLRSQNEFLCRFEMGGIPTCVFLATDARQMLIATVFADLIKGIRFKDCKRKDCPNLFPIESRHKRWFCSQECGHLFYVRQKRARDKRKKLAEERRTQKTK